MNIYEITPEVEVILPSLTKEDEKQNTHKTILSQNIALNSTPPRAVFFANQYINQRWGLVYDLANKHIIQSAYLKPDDLITQIKNVNKKTSRKLDPDFYYVMGFNHDFANYYHWVLQCFPTLMLFREIKKKYENVKLLLPDNLPVFATEYLDIFEDILPKDITFLTNDTGLYYAEKLFYPSFLGGEFAFNISPAIINFYAELTSKIVNQSNFNNVASNNHKLSYFHRLDSENRKILNETNLLELLENKFNASIFSNSSPIKQQIENFRNSDIIISPHGAGLSNLLFCRENTIVIELMPENYINPCFATIAVNKYLNYNAMIFPIKKANSHQHSTVWEVNLSEIEERLQQVMKTS